MHSSKHVCALNRRRLLKDKFQLTEHMAEVHHEKSNYFATRLTARPITA